MKAPFILFIRYAKLKVMYNSSEIKSKSKGSDKNRKNKYFYD